MGRLVERLSARCYSPRVMATDSPIKALLIAITDDASAAVYTVNRLKPELLCFFAPESAKSLVESAVQPKIETMPRKWDWIVTPDAARFMTSYQAAARALPDMMRTWDVQAGELVVDLTGATPAMAAALSLAALPFTSRIVTIGQAAAGSDDEAITIDGQAKVWLQGNPWDEAAAHARHEACEHFNRGSFAAASALFRQIEARVSGGQKPMYRAFADMAEGYSFWDRFQYRQAWDKLKVAHKALDMASVWGGPAGLKSLLPALKQNAGFLEKLVLDPNEVKETLALDLLAHARRRADTGHDYEAAMITLVRALEAFAQFQLFKQYKIKTWDLQPEQLPEALRETCRTCFLSDLDGKYKLPLHDQFRALAGLGSQMGQTYLAQWPKMKPLLDAANQAVLGHGFETLKPERYQQLFEVVMKLTGVNSVSLPAFPVLNL
jgi:CRISPR-associated protein (TIGR02710 family)